MGLVVSVCASSKPRVVVDGFFTTALHTGLGRNVSLVKYFERLYLSAAILDLEGFHLRSTSLFRFGGEGGSSA